MHDNNVTRCLLSLGINRVLFHLACLVPYCATTESTLLARIVPVAAGDQLLEVPDLDHLGFILNLPEFIEIIVDTNREEEFRIKIDDFVDVKGLIMY